MRPKDAVIENTQTVLLSGFAFSIFFTKTGISVFGLASILFILIEKYVIKYEQKNFIPRPVFWLSILFFLDLVLSAALSDHSRWAFSEIGKYRHVLFGGLVLIAHVSNQNRKKVIIVFFIAAALDAFTGVLQYFDIVRKGYDRPHGFSSNPILFAADLAFVCGSAIVLFVIKNDIFTTLKEKYFLAIIAAATAAGIIVSFSRGVWIAICAACTIVLFLYSRGKATVFLIILILLILSLFTWNNALKNRIVSIITSVNTENEYGNTGARLEIWKGSLLLFKEKPVLGVGSGDFVSNIKKLVDQGKLKDVTYIAHAHNIYLHVLATRGLVGLIILLSLFTALIGWGINAVRYRGGVGGYIVMLVTLLTMIGGLTENNIEIHRYLAACCFTMGLISPCS